MAARFFVLVDPARRTRACDHIMRVPDGFEVLVSPPRMSDGQRQKFHAICRDISRSGLEWAGRERTEKQWKTLLISGHATATGQESEPIPGIEGELVDIRESTSTMERGRGSSLIEYAVAFATLKGVHLRDPKRRPESHERPLSAHHMENR